MRYEKVSKKNYPNGLNACRPGSLSKGKSRRFDETFSKRLSVPWAKQSARMRLAAAKRNPQVLQAGMPRPDGKGKAFQACARTISFEARHCHSNQGAHHCAADS